MECLAMSGLKKDFEWKEFSFGNGGCDLSHGTDTAEIFDIDQLEGSRLDCHVDAGRCASGTALCGGAKFPLPWRGRRARHVALP